MPSSPDSRTMDRLRAVLATAKSTGEQLATLHQTDADGREYDVQLASAQWTVIPGRPGVLLFAIPHPLGRPGLWMAAFYVSPNSEYTGSHIAERRRVTVLEGELDCNGRVYGPGQSLTIEPRESTCWKVVAGAAGVTLYELSEPDTSTQP